MQATEIIDNIELEIKKYIDICTIFKKLKDQGCISSLFSCVFEVFSHEHDFTKKELTKLAAQNKESFDFLEHYKLNSSIFKANFLVIVQNIVDEIWGTFLRAEIQSHPSKPMEVPFFTPPVHGPEIEDYMKKPEPALNDSAQKAARQKTGKEGKGGYLAPTQASKNLEHSKSKEKIVQQAFFSNINNSYGSVTSNKHAGGRNTSSGGIKTPNANEKIGVSYNVSSVRSPKIAPSFPVNTPGQRSAKESSNRTGPIQQISASSANNSHVEHKSSFNLIDKYLKT